MSCLGCWQEQHVPSDSVLVRAWCAGSQQLLKTVTPPMVVVQCLCVRERPGLWAQLGSAVGAQPSCELGPGTCSELWLWLSSATAPAIRATDPPVIKSQKMQCYTGQPVPCGGDCAGRKRQEGSGPWAHPRSQLSWMERSLSS